MKFSEIQSEFDSKIKNAGAVAVCSVLEPEKACRIAESLLKNGISAMEIAYRKLDSFEKTDACIKSVRREVPEMLLGAATVINPEIARRAKKSGAQFILSPGFNPKTVKFCKKNRIPVYPGVLTPSEIEAALAFGLTTLKFFPSEASGGIPLLKSLKGPFPNVKFIVSGGLNSENEKSYRELDNVIAVSGSWLSDSL